eukprot:8218163-Alexandrium_andersonii.AAC.2
MSPTSASFCCAWGAHGFVSEGTSLDGPPRPGVPATDPLESNVLENLTLGVKVGSLCFRPGPGGLLTLPLPSRTQSCGARGGG